MVDANLFQILQKWNFWERPVEPGFPRDITRTVVDAMQGPEVIVLQGVRRSGKSTILFQLMEALLVRGVAPREILYINFEEPLFFDQRQTGILEQLYTLYRERVNPQGPAWVFLDEVQEISGWEKWARARTDLREVKLFVTGSSSSLLASEYGTLLTGRHLSFTVYPLSFREFLRVRGLAGPWDEVSLAARKALIRNLLREYLQFGGFPEVVLREREDLKERLLKQYFEDILYRDIVGRYQVRDVATLKNIALLYMTGIAAPSSYNRIKNALDVPLDVVRSYSGYLAESFLVREVLKHSFKVKEQLRNPKKVYAIDPGIRNAVSYRFSEDLGRLAENVVYLSLLRQEREVYYHKERGEVDFLVREGMRTAALVQVCVAGEGEGAWGRELQALEEAMVSLGLQEGLLITDDREEEITLETGVVRAVPLWKWLVRG